MPKNIMTAGAKVLRKKLIYDPIDFIFGKAGYEVKKKTGAQKSVMPAKTYLSLETFAARNNLTIDRISNVSQVVDELITFLRSRGCFIQIIKSDRDKTCQIAAKYQDIDFIANCVRDFKFEGIQTEFIHVPRHYGHRMKIPFFLKSPGKIYAFYDLTLDPWLEDQQRVYSHSPNPFVSSVSKFYINRTVCALHPYSLQGNPEGDISLSSMLKIDQSLDQRFDFPIDAVYTWVDGSDQKWLDAKAARLGLDRHNQESVSHTRFRSINELRFSLRSILSFAPFVRNIYIVTDKQKPAWINEHHPQVKFVDHTEIFASKAALPTYNSHAIEANLHRINGLSEHFLYVNDDVIFWNKCQPTDFFHANGLTKSFLERLPNVYGPVLPSTPAWRAGALNSNELIKAKYGKTLNTHHLHTPFALRRSVIAKMWDEFSSPLEKVTNTPFRSSSDISPVSFLYHAFSFCEGQSTFESLEERRMSLASGTFQPEIVAALNEPAVKVVCINDGDSEYYEANKNAFYAAMLRKFPISAPWELDR
ncbi:Stealth CR1 domain-containing protein [Agrobacterium rosae]|uniref:Stealth CR1 domain-containing protein n=1 Tax=Agrobacterium rosae TaxID=1972867 RepID=A0ABU4W818_9HYPH|nr:Stealth CR1 domain-containing protein [Agrobacterium rosae]MDX8332792.1 Stealth CR1 domain-containing protein [Agrobacterium rosae]